MDISAFENFLRGRKLPEERIGSLTRAAQQFEDFLSASGSTGIQAVHTFSEQLIAEGKNDYDTYLAVVQYGRFTGSPEVVVAAIELLDGAEVLDNLHKKLAGAVGEKVRDEIFFEVELPPFGTLPEKKPPLMAKIIDRMEQALSPETCHSILKDSLRNLPDSYYVDARQKYQDSESLPDFLAQKGDEFIAFLRQLMKNGELYFTQPVTEEVIEYVEDHPEIRQGVLLGSQIIEAKIPYQTIDYLHETDPQMKAYYYCHCPWVRESIKSGEASVSPTFCTCSGGYHKRYWEATLGQPLEAEVLETVLDGGEWCKFAITLPDGLI